MPNQYINKVVYGTTVLVDLTEDTVDADFLLESLVAHAADGSTIVGTVPNGDLLGYGLGTSPRVNVGKADSAIVQDYTGTATGKALAGLAVLAE